MESKNIAIFAAKVKDLLPWDPDSIKSGISGSEESVIYMSQELAQLGYRVFVFGDPPKDSLHSMDLANPRFVSWDHPIDLNFFDIAISCRMPFIGEFLRRIAKQVYLWPQDILVESLTDNQVNAFNDVFWISRWQREQWISINYLFERFTGIYGNGINLDQFHEIEERENPYSCIYGSNYSRGLEVLLDIWPEIKAKFPQATLSICYGWKHWGTLNSNKEAKIRTQIQSLANMGVHHFGLVGHERLNREYAKASFWTYPCIVPETFCITGLRAQFSGSIPVIIDGSALVETVQYGYKCSRPEEYLMTLKYAMQQVEQFSLQNRRDMRAFITEKYTWRILAEQYKNRFDSFELK